MRTPIMQQMPTRMGNNRSATRAFMAAMASIAMIGIVGSSPATAQSQQAETSRVIHIDPNTGAVLKSATENSVTLELDQFTVTAMRSDSDDLPKTKNADGSTSVDLQGRFQSPLIATITPDGKVKQQHINK